MGKIHHEAHERGVFDGASEVLPVPIRSVFSPASFTSTAMSRNDALNRPVKPTEHGIRNKESD
jgi:hypothetical protein